MNSLSREFYEAIKYRVEAGQFKMEDIMNDLDVAWGKGLITADQYHELKSRAFETCDPNYKGNRVATPYDEGQDVKIMGNTMATIENFEMILAHEEMIYELMESLVDTGQIKAEKCLISARSAIGDNYVLMIVAGKRTFESVPARLKQEVADKLIAMGREDLVTDPEYLPQLPEEVLPEPEETLPEEMPEGDFPVTLPEMDRPTILPEVDHPVVLPEVDHPVVLPEVE